MARDDHVARASVDIEAGKAQVWDALVDPDQISQYMFGAKVRSDWVEGSEITWEGEWQGSDYQDRGEIIDIDPGNTLRYTHYSPLSGQPDAPENYHNVAVDLTGDDSVTTVTLTQDNNDTAEAAEHAEKNWQTMLDGLKYVVEKAP
jgi:uncharacterized protein YndB with AHSA1/START domain